MITATHTLVIKNPTLTPFIECSCGWGMNTKWEEVWLEFTDHVAQFDEDLAKLAEPNWPKGEK